MFECVQICTVSDTLPALQRLPPVRSARRGLSGIECRPVQRVQRPGVCALPCVVCPAARDVQAVRVRWGLGLHLWGIWGEPGVGWSTPRVEKIQKRRFIKVVVNHHPRLSAQNTPPLLPISKISRKNKKDPYKGSAFCAILALQALKGRNL